MLHKAAVAPPPTGGRRPALLLLFSGFAVSATLTACSRDVVPPGDLRLTPGLRALSVVNPDSGTWDTFEADVTIIVRGAGSGPDAQQAKGGMSYTVRKSRDPEGRWLTELRVSDYRTIANGRRPNVGFSRIARSAHAPDGRGSLYYGPAGELLPQRLEPPALPQRQGGAPITGFSEREVSPRMLDTSRSWLDRYIVTPAAAQRERARLARYLGDATKANGRSRFTMTRGTTRAEIVLHDSSGVVEEERLSENGRPVAVTSRRYVELSNGVRLLAHENISRAPRRGGEPHRVVDIYFTNLRLTRER